MILVRRSVRETSSVHEPCWVARQPYRTGLVYTFSRLFVLNVHKVGHLANTLNYFSFSDYKKRESRIWTGFLGSATHHQRHNFRTFHCFFVGNRGGGPPKKAVLSWTAREPKVGGARHILNGGRKVTKTEPSVHVNFHCCGYAIVSCCSGVMDLSRNIRFLQLQLQIQCVYPKGAMHVHVRHDNWASSIVLRGYFSPLIH